MHFWRSEARAHGPSEWSSKSRTAAHPKTLTSTGCGMYVRPPTPQPTPHHHHLDQPKANKIHSRTCLVMQAPTHGPQKRSSKINSQTCLVMPLAPKPCKLRTNQGIQTDIGRMCVSPRCGYMFLQKCVVVQVKCMFSLPKDERGGPPERPTKTTFSR